MYKSSLKKTYKVHAITSLTTTIKQSNSGNKFEEFTTNLQRTK